MNEDCSPRRMLDDYRKLRSAQIVLSRELGMTPLARQQLQAGSANVPVDIVAAMAAERCDALAAQIDGAETVAEQPAKPSESDPST